MEARLNAENRGQSFNAKNCTTWIKVLLRTQAFSESFVLRRKTAIDRIQREVNAQLRKVTDIHSKAGIIIEDSPIAEHMVKMNEDDIARARQVLDDNGKASAAPGITSCLYTNDSINQGEVPILKTVLKECGKKNLYELNNLFLTLDRELPNEFTKFPRITALTFPDKFPLYVDDHTFMGEGTLDLKVRRHLLNFYDGRFCDADFIF